MCTIIVVKISFWIIGFIEAINVTYIRFLSKKSHIKKLIHLVLSLFLFFLWTIYLLASDKMHICTFYYCVIKFIYSLNLFEIKNYSRSKKAKFYELSPPLNWIKNLCEKSILHYCKPQQSINQSQSTVGNIKNFRTSADIHAS